MAFAGKLGSLLKQSVCSDSSATIRFPMTSLLMNQVRFMSAVKKLIKGKLCGKTGGRNETGRVTAWHRGGGHKRLHRAIDMKRSIAAWGIVERVEYDPHRSADIALVRWEEGVEQPTHGRSIARKSAKPNNGRLSLSSSSSGGVNSSMDQYVVIGRPNSSLPFWERSVTTEGDVKARVRDILFSTLTPRHNTRRLTKKEKKRTNSLSFSNSLAGLAGAEPAFFKRMKEGRC